MNSKLGRQQRLLIEEMIRRGLPLPAFQDERRSRDIKQAKELAEKYRFDAAQYIQDKLGWAPWAGSEEAPGQAEIIAAYELALKQQHERNDYEQGRKTLDELEVWKPGQTIQNELRIEAGHTVGKTKLSSGLVNHFFDCFPPSIVYTFAPSWVQIHDLLWKEIKADRRGKGLPGRILDLRLEIDDNHFATGKATNDNGGKGTEKIQGQHGEYLLFVIDEAEGVPDFVWSAIDSMTGGGICIVLMLANPKTRSSKFHKRKTQVQVKSFRISCIHHPNVVAGREIVPGAVKRQYIEKMMQSDDSFVEVVAEHDDDEHTFTLPFEVNLAGTLHAPGTIFKPGGQFCWRVLGIAPKNASVNIFVPPGRYEAACKPERLEAALDWEGDPKNLLHLLAVQMGVDASRYGDDFGTLYIRHALRAWRAEQFWKEDTQAYAGPIKERAVARYEAIDAYLRELWQDDEITRHQYADYLKKLSLSIRVDAGGGFGSGVIDALKNDSDLKALFPKFEVLEVHFNGTPNDESAYDDLATEMYAEAAETLKRLAILKAPTTLEADLCERPFKWVNRAGVSVKRLLPKDTFRDDFKRSPDDGDGFVLAVAPAHIFNRKRKTAWA